VIQVIAPHCPDCGQVCLHPALMAVDCPKCSEFQPLSEAELAHAMAVGRLDAEALAARLEPSAHGRSDDEIHADLAALGPEPKSERSCSDCNGTGKVCPMLTDEQIVGRKCERCDGSGYDAGWKMTCLDCTGTGRVGGIENRWVCLEKYAVLRGGCGHSDIVADDATWREFLQCLKTRTKTTVFEDAEVYHGGIFDYAHDRPAHENLSLSLLPDWVVGRRGRVTITVTFEPAEKP